MVVKTDRLRSSRFGSWSKFGNAAISVAEDHVARFAIGAIAMLDQINPRMEADGKRPWTGVFLTVKWKYYFGIMGVIVGLQVIVGALTISSTRNVYCQDDSHIVSARLLRGVVERLGSHGTAATAEQLYAVYREELMRYGVIGAKYSSDRMERLGIVMESDNLPVGHGMDRKHYYA